MRKTLLTCAVAVGMVGAAWSAGSACADLRDYAALVREDGGAKVWTAALQKALYENACVRIPASSETYWIDAPVIVPSGRSIRARGATISLLKGCNTLMLRNASAVDGQLKPIPSDAMRDSGISIEGGTWCDWRDKRAGYGVSGRFNLGKRERGNFYGVSTLFYFGNVNGLALEDVTFVRCAGFAVQCGDAKDVTFRHIRFERCYADGLHLNGNLEHVRAYDVKGCVGDDLVALNAYDWQNSSVNFGPQRDMVFEDIELIKPETGSYYPAIRILPAVYRYADGTEVDCAISNVVFRKVRGIKNFKMYAQTPPCAIGKAREWYKVGSGGDIVFEDVVIDLDGPIDAWPGTDYVNQDPERGHIAAFEFGANLSKVTFRDVTVNFHCDRWGLSHLALVGPKSCRWFPKKRGDPMIEVFDPDLSCEVGEVVLDNVKATGVVPKELVRATAFDNINKDGESTGRGVISKLTTLRHPPVPALDYAFKESVSLDGDWEMAYCPYFLEVNTYPTFAGMLVKGAIPGYWEDMVPAFRSAGITDAFRINPEYAEQTLPQVGWAPDTQLPQPYGTFFYRRKVNLAQTEHAVLAFEGVRNDVRVWVNGRFVEYRAGYSTPFTIEIPSDYLRVGENEITLAVANKLNLGYLGAEVRGLTSRALFRATGGVNGHLELQFLANDLHDIAVTTAEDLQTFTIRVHGTAPYRYRITDGAREMASGDGAGDTVLSARGYAFWSPENPKRYLLTIETPSGEVRQHFGLRRLTAKGTALYLNGTRTFLRGITEHCYFPTTVHLPRDVEYYRMITRKRKALGFNFVRFHTFVPPVEYLEAMDELGMMVEMESPNFVREAEYAAIIAFARRHPSVVMYSTGNETRIDRLVEVYLREIADMVHARTDSLFSPMSALRGVSYAVFEDVEPVVEEPYRHNPERAERLAAFSDLFNACSDNATSYDYIGQPHRGAADIDSWAPLYANKPRLLHELCIDGTYADLTLEGMYPAGSPIVGTKLFSNVRRVLTEKGIVDRAGVYFTNSCAWVAQARKYAFEKARACETIAGFDFLGDINSHWHTYGYSVGMMDEFYRLKPGETSATVLHYNGPAVLLADFDSDFVFPAGAMRPVKIGLSNFACEATNARIEATLRDVARGVDVAAWVAAVPVVKMGLNTNLATVPIALPDVAEAKEYALVVRVASATFVAENVWPLYAFPTVQPRATGALRVVTDISRSDLLAAMQRGETVVLFGSGPFPTSPMTHHTGRAGRCSGNFATVVKAGHSAFAGFPHAGFCGWQFRHLMENAKVLQIEADIPFDPIVDVASAVKCPIRQAALTEYRVGTRGRLLVCTFNFQDRDPAAAFLKARLLEYAASTDFLPKDAITVEQLAMWIDTPRVKTTGNSNRALNPGDPSLSVRIGNDLMP